MRLNNGEHGAITGRKYEIKNYCACDIDHIFCIINHPCGINCVGEALRSLKTCIINLKSAIRQEIRIPKLLSITCNIPILYQASDLGELSVLRPLWQDKKTL